MRPNESQGSVTPNAPDLVRLADVCRRYGIAELLVFGSFARSQFGPASDVDLIYVLQDGIRMGFSLFDLERELEDVFGRSVDLLEKANIHRLLRDDVLADAKLLYAA